ncbi:MalY/PatB family protein [Janibacter sp. GXQ6167]|uniref:MalY/PatB family protein n=1 Tax=Janibacter sp. GXQ6167 TaxID=3240791 RepID=UPI003526A20E
MRLQNLGYPVAGTYLEAVARWTEAAWGWRSDPGASRLVTDVMSGVGHALSAVTDPGDPVLITVPVYPPFHWVVKDIGRELVMVPLLTSGRLDLDALGDAMAAARRRAPRAALLLASPHNPTGVAHTAAELEAVMALADQHDVSVVVDEIHAPLVLPGAEFVPVQTVSGGSRAISVISPAKGWNLAALKSAAIVPGADATAAMTRVPPLASFSASHMAVQAHVAAMDHGADWLADLVSDLGANRSLLADLLAEHLPDARWQPHEATYLAWLDLTAYGLGDDPAAALLDRARVALNPGPSFGPGGEGFVRINTATSPEILTEAIIRISAAL